MDKRLFIVKGKRPDYNILLLATIEAHKQIGKAAHYDEIDKKISEIEKLSKEELLYPQSSTQTFFQYYSGKIRTILRYGNALKKIKPGVDELTDYGRTISDIESAKAIIEYYNNKSVNRDLISHEEKADEMQLDFESIRKQILDSVPETGSEFENDGGFFEGNRISRFHLMFERSSSLREQYFKHNPTATCDICTQITNKKYPWTHRVLDLHHVLPLSTILKADANCVTRFSDLVPVCPTCHRAVHSFYSIYLREEGKDDFENKEEAWKVYKSVKEKIED